MENILVFIRIIFDILISGECVIEDIWGGFAFHDVCVVKGCCKAEILKSCYLNSLWLLIFIFLMLNKVLLSSDTACNEISQKTHKAQESFMGLNRNRKLEKVFTEKSFLFHLKLLLHSGKGNKHLPSKLMRLCILKTGCDFSLTFYNRISGKQI